MKQKIENYCAGAIVGISSFMSPFLMFVDLQYTQTCIWILSLMAATLILIKNWCIEEVKQPETVERCFKNYDMKAVRK